MDFLNFINSLADWMEDDPPDRTTQNESDGQVFYGYDDDEGNTGWYSEDGTFEGDTPTPNDDDDDWW